MSLVPIERLGPYRIIATLGRGGMGVVYRARHELLEREVAIKVLRAPPDADDASSETLARFVREAQAVARLGAHANVVAVHDVSVDARTPYYVMDLVEGRSLGVVLAEDGPLPVERALAITGRLAAALHHAHRHGVLHRDVKPTNILIDHMRGEPHLTDFGLARLADGQNALTQTGTVLGTPYYMAPEQVRGHRLDQRTDVYSAGVVLYEMLTGVRPFTASSVYAVMMQVIEKDAAPPRSLRREVPAAVEALCRRAMARDPAERFDSAQELARACVELRGGPPSAVPDGEPARLSIEPGGGAGAGAIAAAAAPALEDGDSRRTGPGETLGGLPGSGASLEPASAALLSPDQTEAATQAVRPRDGPGSTRREEPLAGSEDADAEGGARLPLALSAGVTVLVIGIAVTALALQDRIAELAARVGIGGGAVASSSGADAGVEDLPPDPDADAIALIGRGDELLAEALPRDAEAEYELAVELGSAGTRARAMLRLGALHLLGGRPRAAAASAARAAAIGSPAQRLLAHELEARAALVEGDQAAARAALIAAGAAAGEEPDASLLRLRARTRYAPERPPGAAPATLLARLDVLPGRRTRRGGTTWAGDPAAARADLDAAFAAETRGHDPETLLALGELDLTTGRPEDARGRFEAALAAAHLVAARGGADDAATNGADDGDESDPTSEPRADLVRALGGAALPPEGPTPALGRAWRGIGLTHLLSRRDREAIDAMEQALEAGAPPAEALAALFHIADDAGDDAACDEIVGRYVRRVLRRPAGGASEGATEGTGGLTGDAAHAAAREAVGHLVGGDAAAAHRAAALIRVLDPPVAIAALEAANERAPSAALEELLVDRRDAALRATDAAAVALLADGLLAQEPDAVAELERRLDELVPSFGRVLVSSSRPLGIRLAAAIALTESADPRALEALRGALDVEADGLLLHRVISGLRRRRDRAVLAAVAAHALDPSPVREAVADYVEELGDRATVLPFLRAIAKESPFAGNVRAYAIIARHAGDGAILVPILEDPDPAVRAAACFAIAARRDGSAAARLRRRLEEDDDPYVRLAAAFALAELGDPAGAAPALRAIAHPDRQPVGGRPDTVTRLAPGLGFEPYRAFSVCGPGGDPRVDAVALLAWIGDRDAGPLFDAALRSREPAFIVNGSFGLAMIAGEGDVAALAALLRHEDAWVRANALFGIARVAAAVDASGRGRLVAVVGPPVRALLSGDESDEVRSNAAIALTAMGDRAAVDALGRALERARDQREATYHAIALDGLGGRAPPALATWVREGTPKNPFFERWHLPRSIRRSSGD